MRFKVGQKVRVVNPHYGCYFYSGDVVEIVRIGTVDGKDMNCYGARYEGSCFLWYLHEDEVESIEYKATPITNGDKIRAMSNRELADMLLHGVKGANCKRCPHLHKPTCTTENSCIDGIEAYLNSPVEEK